MGNLNYRPFLPLSLNSNETEVLTPDRFEIDRATTTTPEFDVISVNENQLHRWQRIAKLTQMFRKRHNRDYISYV